jgi:hypothetical protein
MFCNTSQLGIAPQASRHLRYQPGSVSRLLLDTSLILVQSSSATSIQRSTTAAFFPVYIPRSKSFLPLKMPSQADDKRQAAREVIDILHEISMLLVCRE